MTLLYVGVEGFRVCWAEKVGVQAFSTGDAWTLGAWSLIRESKACARSFLPKLQVFLKYEPRHGDVNSLMYCG